MHISDQKDKANDRLLFCIDELINEGVSNKSIALALLEISLDFVSGEKVNVVYPSDENIGEDDFSSVSEDDFMKEFCYEEYVYNKEELLAKEKFGKEYERLSNKVIKFGEMGELSKMIDCYLELTEITPLHISKYKKIVGDENFHNYRCHVVNKFGDKVFKLLSVSQNEKNISRFIKNLGIIDSLLPEDASIFDVLMSKRDKNEIMKEYSKKIMDFVSDNPGCYQYKINSELSLDNRVSLPTINLMEDMGVIKKTKSGSRWLLYPGEYLAKKT